MTDNMVDEQVMTTDEITLVRRAREKHSFQVGYAAALNAVENRLNSLADECGGGDGTGDTADTLRMAAKTVADMTVP